MTAAARLIHAANILLLVAYSVRDILWLRLFAVGASLVSIPYFLLQPTTQSWRLLWFQGLAASEGAGVLSIGSWVTAQPGERMIESGTVPDAVWLIVSGNVRMTRDRQVVGVLGAGQFVGSALILSGLQADVEAVVETPARAIRWQVGTLERYLNADPDTQTAMQRHLSRDLATKVERLAAGDSAP